MRLELSMLLTGARRGWEKRLGQQSGSQGRRRTATAERRAWVAEQLTRTGAFGLIVLDGCLPEPTAAHRLRSLAREHDAAVVISIGSDVSPAWRADLRVAFRCDPRAPPGLAAGGRFRRVARVGIPKLGGGAVIGEGEIEIVHEPPNLLSPADRGERRDRRPGGRLRTG
jgi:hypothetical protein